MSEYAGRTLNASGDVADIFIDPDHPFAKRAKLALSATSIDDFKKSLRSLTQVSGMSAMAKPLLIAELVDFVETNPDIRQGKPFYCKLMCELTWLYVPLDEFERPMFYFACQACRRKVVE